MTDSQLLAQYLHHRSPEALAEIVRRHTDLVYATALRETGDHHRAQDVAQAVFLVFVRRAPALSSSVVLSGWFFKTTIYAANDARKLAARRQFHEREASPMETARTSTPDVALIREDLRAQLNQAVMHLPAPDRDAIALRYLSGLSTPEMAAALGTTELVARKRISRALERLRKLFLRRGTVLSVGLLPLALESLKSAAPACVSQHLQSAALGTAAPNAFSQSIAQGVIHMYRRSHLQLTAITTGAVLTGVVLLTALGFALAAVPAVPPVAVAATGTSVTAPVTPPPAIPPAQIIHTGEFEEIDAMPVAAVRTWTQFATLVPMDPYRDAPRFTAQQQADLETRLRREMAAYIGPITTAAWDQSLPRAIDRRTVFVGRHLPLTHWNLTGDGGTADVWADPSGAIQVLIRNAQRLPASEAAAIAAARQALVRYWGADPGDQPPDVEKQSDRFIFRWNGPDGKTSSPQTTLEVRFRRPQLDSTGRQSFATIAIEGGIAPDQWRKLDAAEIVKRYGGLTERQAIASAASYLDWLSGDPSGKALAQSFRIAQPTAPLKVLPALRTEPGHRWSVNFLGDQRYHLTIEPDGQINGVGADAVRAGDAPAAASAVPLAEVRKWNEYVTWAAAQQHKIDLMNATWSRDKEPLRQVIQAIRPGAGDMVENVLLEANRSSDTLLQVRMPPATGRSVEAHLEMDRPDLRLSMLRLTLPPVAELPPQGDQDAWQKYASQTLSQVFGKKPEGVLNIGPFELWAQERRSWRQPRANATFHRFCWSPGWHGLPLPESYSTIFEVHAGTAMTLYWSQAPERIRPDITAIEQAPIKISAQHAAQAVVKSAPLIVPDVPIDEGVVSVIMRVNDLAPGWEQYATWFNGPALTRLRARSPLAPLWEVEIELVWPPVRGSSHSIHAEVDPETGEIVKFREDGWSKSGSSD